MKDPILIFLGIAMLMVSVLCAWTVLTQRVRLALGVEWGIGLMTFGFGSAGVNLVFGNGCTEASLMTQIGALGAGVAVIVGSVWVKAIQHNHPIRRLEDFREVAMRGDTT